MEVKNQKSATTHTTTTYFSPTKYHNIYHERRIQGSGQPGPSEALAAHAESGGAYNINAFADIREGGTYGGRVGEGVGVGGVGINDIH